MSIVVAVIIRIAGLFGFKLSGFAAGAIMTAALFLAFGAYSYKLYEAGRNSAQGECETAALRSQLDAAKADRDNARMAAASASLRMASIEAESGVERERTEKYVDELKQRIAAGEAGNPAVATVSKCELTCDDLRGMRIPSAACGTGSRSSGPTLLHVPGFSTLRGSKR